MRCQTCDLADELDEALAQRNDLSAWSISLWSDVCQNCLAIRGAHNPQHPHTRFRHCPGFAHPRRLPLHEVVEDLLQIEQGLRAA